MAKLAERTDAHRRLADDEGDGDGRSAAARRASRSSTSAPASRISRRPTPIKAAAHAAHRRELHASTRRSPASPSCGARSATATAPTTASSTRSREVIVTAGGKQALFNTALALFGPGDEVITHAPYWPTLPEQIKLADATPVARADARRGRLRDPRASAILDAITPRTRGIIINSPCNPTGALIAEERARRPSREAAARRGIWVIVDLCYEKLIYDPVPHNLPARRSRGQCRDLGGDLRVGVEGVRDDRLALRLDDRPGGGHRRVERDSEPRDVERHRRSRRRRSSPRSPGRRSRCARCSTSTGRAATSCTSG